MEYVLIALCAAGGELPERMFCHPKPLGGLLDCQVWLGIHMGAEFLLVQSQFAPDACPVPTELVVKTKAAQMQNDAIQASQIRLVIS